MIHRDATAHQLATGVAQIDGLTGGEARLTGGVSSNPDVGIRFDNLSLSGSQAVARLDGTANSKVADITALVTSPSLEKADERLSGRGEAKAHITGTFEHPDATLSVQISNGALLGRSVPSVTLEARLIFSAAAPRLPRSPSAFLASLVDCRGR